MENYQVKSRALERIPPQPRQNRHKPDVAQDEVPHPDENPSVTQKESSKDVEKVHPEDQTVSTGSPAKNKTIPFQTSETEFHSKDNLEDWAAERNLIRSSRVVAYRKRKHRRKSTAPRWRGRLFGFFGLLLASLSAVLFFSGYLIGHWAAEKEGKKQIKERMRVLHPDHALPDEIIRRLNAALAAPDANTSLQMLLALQKETPEIGSLDYLIATRALQAGNTRLAMLAAQNSIDKCQRVAEATTMLALFTPSENRLRVLSKALAADPANPFPHLALVMLLRAEGDRAGAEQALQSVRLRLMPVEPALVVGVIEALFQLEKTADVDLPEKAETLRVGDTRWVDAYLSMRRGDFSKAARILAQIRADSSQHIFNFMKNDPAFRPFLKKTEIEELLK